MNPKDQSLRELAKFAKFILSKFLTVASTNKKVFIELFFWKTSKEATEIVEGYGTQTNSNKYNNIYMLERTHASPKTLIVCMSLEQTIH